MARETNDLSSFNKTVYSKGTKVFCQIKLLILACVLAASLGACTTNDLAFGNGKPLPALTFDYYKPLNIRARNIQVYLTDTESDKSTVDDFIIPLPNALHNYINARFKAQGGFETLSFYIEKASISKEYNASSNRVAEYLKVGGYDVYRIAVQLRYEFSNSDGVYGERMNFERMLSISEHSSLSHREQRQIESLEELFEDIDRALLESFQERNTFSLR